MVDGSCQAHACIRHRAHNGDTTASDQKCAFRFSDLVGTGRLAPHSDYFITPVAADLFSLRALTTVGRAIGKWITDWKIVRDIASEGERERLLIGEPNYLGYIASASKVSSGLRKAQPHSYWEGKIAPRVASRVVDTLKAINPALTPFASTNKMGEVKHFHSLAAAAQVEGLPIGKLRGHVNPGHCAQVDEAREEFAGLAKELVKRMKI